MRVFNSRLVGFSVLSLGLVATAALATYSAGPDCSLADGRPGKVLSLETGDWSCDGHCLTEKTQYCSSLDGKAFQDALTQGETKLGIKFSDVVAGDYEDSSISKEVLEALVKNQVKIPEEVLDERDPESGASTLTTETYTQIVLEIARLGRPDFKYTPLPLETIQIGGYGLFSP